MVTTNIAIVPPASQQSPIVDVAVAPSTIDIHTKAIPKPVSKPVQPYKKPQVCTSHKKKFGFGAARNKYGAVGKPRPAPATAVLLAQPLMLTAGVQPMALLPAVCTVSVAKPAIDTSPLVKAAEKKKEKVDMVLSYITPEIQPASTIAQPTSNGHRFWAGRSPTPGLSETINTKECAAALSRARTEHSDWLINPERVRRLPLS